MPERPKKCVKLSSMATQNSQPSDSQAIPALKRPRSRKSPAIKTAVIAKYAQGQDKTSIANELGITRNTVRAIVNETDVDRHLSANQTVSLELIPRAIQVAHDRLAKGSENMAIHVLENTIWPLNAKTSKSIDTGLTLAIQNLMGNVQVNAPAASTEQKANENAVSSEPEQPISK
jgi:transposase-like protein